MHPHSPHLVGFPKTKMLMGCVVCRSEAGYIALISLAFHACPALPVRSLCGLLRCCPRIFDTLYNPVLGSRPGVGVVLTSVKRFTSYMGKFISKNVLYVHAFCSCWRELSDGPVLPGTCPFPFPIQAFASVFDRKFSSKSRTNVLREMRFFQQ